MLNLVDLYPGHYFKEFVSHTADMLKGVLEGRFTFTHIQWGKSITPLAVFKSASVKIGELSGVTSHAPSYDPPPV